MKKRDNYKKRIEVEDDDEYNDKDEVEQYKSIDENISITFKDFFSNLYNAFFVWETDDDINTDIQDTKYKEDKEKVNREDCQNLCPILFDRESSKRKHTAHNRLSRDQGKVRRTKTKSKRTRF